IPGRRLEPVTGSGCQKFGYEKPATRNVPSASTTVTATLAQASAAFLIQLEFVLIVLLECRVLRFLAQEAIAHRERLDLGAHEAAEHVFRAAEDRLAAHVEAGVEDHRADRLLLVMPDYLVEARF